MSCEFKEQCGFIKYITEKNKITINEATCGREEEAAFCPRYPLNPISWINLDDSSPTGSYEMELAHPRIKRDRIK